MQVNARRRLRNLTPGAVTVVTVTWDSRDYLEVLIKQVRRQSPPGTTLLVVDNGSRDGTRRWLAQHPDIRILRLPVNLGHSLALDLGFLSVHTEFAISLDVDAFPISDAWLEETLRPLRRGAVVAGARLNRQYVHPCWLGMRTRTFVDRRLSFAARYVDGAGDVGENLSAAAGGDLHFFDPSSQRGPGDVGTVFGGLVYHNFYATRFQREGTEQLDGLVASQDPVHAWREAKERWIDD